MIIKKMNDVPAQVVTIEGAKDATMRVLIGPADAAPTFAMRLFELAPGGHTPFHTHPFEHEVLILDDGLVAVSDTAQTPLEKGNALLVPADEKHQFKNVSAQNARFICLVPVAYQK